MLSKTSYVYSLIRDAKLADGFKRGGNASSPPANTDLKYGPDLGGISVIGDEGAYRPASERYNGRFYVPVTQGAWASIPALKDRVRVLIMSGLYRLIEPDEWIRKSMCTSQTPMTTMVDR